jgi:predicted membrane channel-forming protein YqfA (hemolysin III family)
VYRTLIYIGSGVLSACPVVHYISVYGVSHFSSLIIGGFGKSNFDAIMPFPNQFEAMVAFLYLLGAAVYVLKVPER